MYTYICYVYIGYYQHTEIGCDHATQWKVETADCSIMRVNVPGATF